MGEENSGLHRPPHIINVLYADGRLHSYQHDRVTGGETHGTGCTFAAAITANLATRLPLATAVANAGAFVGDAIANCFDTGDHRPLGIGWS
jgi:hydroxymethylpyrimidine/phosphomethylpyrimidine kinase